MKSIHPFPARMAPEIALNSLKELSKHAIVLDPMAGSGTVLRQAVLKGHKAIGFDMDPLAVMMSNAATQPVNFELLDKLYNWLINKAKNTEEKRIKLSWMDKDSETKEFVKYWFGLKQRKVLRRIAYILHTSQKIKSHVAENNILRIALSRLIVTKKSGASLAWDVSHSRPHKVCEKNDYDVWEGYTRSYTQLRKILSEQNILGTSKVHKGDARKMTPIRRSSIDAVITSPPYLNAIDYLRGHKLSLVWLGYTISEIRAIRSDSIGVERQRTDKKMEKVINEITLGLSIQALSSRQTKMIQRYAHDACLLMKEIARVLKPHGKAVFVVGNSCLKETYIENSKIFCEAAKHYKLILKKQTERELPIGSRYLPLPKDATNALSKRMKTEVILEFAFR